MRSFYSDKMVVSLIPMNGFAHKYRDLKPLWSSHWMQDFVLDYENVDRLISNLPFRGVKGPKRLERSQRGAVYTYIYACSIFML